MNAGQILEFPKKQSIRVRAQAKVRNQKAVLALSILSVVILSVITNQFITRPMGNSGGSRGIASVGAAVPAMDVRWEHELARELSQSKDQAREAHLAERPSLKDELLYGALEGRYGARLKDGRVLSLEFVNSMAGETALEVKDRSAFLSKYKGVFAVEFDRAGLLSSDSNQETWNLVNTDRTIVGQAKFFFDTDGRIASLLVE